MSIYKCERCGKVISYNNAFVSYESMIVDINYNKYDKYSICKDCKEDFYRFMKGEKINEKK